MNHKPKILIVDDNEKDFIKIIEFLDEDFEITIKNSSLEALDLLSKQSFDLILLDIDMPKLDGIEFAKSLNQNMTLTTLQLFL